VTTSGYTSGLQKFTNYSDNTPDVATAYDASGRVSTITQASQSRIAYAYDPADLTLDTETISYFPNGTAYDFSRVVDHSQDTTGRNNGYQLKSGATVQAAANYQFSTDTGRVATIDDGTRSFDYGYENSSHLIATITARVGSGTVFTVHNTPFGDRDILHLKDNRLGTTTTSISKTNYAVNSLGQRTDAQQDGTALTTRNTHWHYDGLGQVTLADESNAAGDRAYAYDDIGNRKKSVDGLAASLPTSDNYTSNSRNQYSVVPFTSATPTYDDDGNALTYPLPLTGGPTGTLNWDGENRLISATVGGATTTYQYDALGRRISQATGSSLAVYVYDGMNCIGEYEGSAFTLHADNLWGLDLSWTVQGAGGVGGLLAVNMLTGPAAGINYPLYDGNGNITEYLNGSGAVVAHYEYDPFGRIFSSSGSLKDAFTYRFSTKPLDAATGLYCYIYRYYEPVTGRWMSRDPLEERGGSNLYEFVGNDAICLVDPDGRTPSFRDIGNAVFAGLTYVLTLISSNDPSHVKPPQTPTSMNQKIGDEFRKNMRGRKRKGGKGKMFSIDIWSIGWGACWESMGVPADADFDWMTGEFTWGGEGPMI